MHVGTIALVLSVKLSSLSLHFNWILFCSFRTTPDADARTVKSISRSLNREFLPDKKQLGVPAFPKFNGMSKDLKWENAPSPSK